MTTTEIKDQLNKPKFTPIILHLNNGQNVTVKHPDYLMVTETQRSIVVTEGEHLYVINIESITAIESVA